MKLFIIVVITILSFDSFAVDEIVCKNDRNRMNIRVIINENSASMLFKYEHQSSYKIIREFKVRETRSNLVFFDDLNTSLPTSIELNIEKMILLERTSEMISEWVDPVPVTYEYNCIYL